MKLAKDRALLVHVLGDPFSSRLALQQRYRRVHRTTDIGRVAERTSLPRKLVCDGCAADDHLDRQAGFADGLHRIAHGRHGRGEQCGQPEQFGLAVCKFQQTLPAARSLQDQ
jgi:hypothetical protein